MKRTLLGAVVAIVMLLAACGGSEAIDNAISEDAAVETAIDAAGAEGFSTNGLDIVPNLIFGEWQVSFNPPNTDDLSGGFMVALNAMTGEVLEVIEFR